ncbi:hypothetical protein BMH32_06155 [Leucobacter sp. OLJS4]|uniref:hypothetical protein n=1 Tax=unclassified Leucobacter TaxID=2621730 RepID=UPI000C1A51D2|nr:MULTISPECIES: hypothetical protein [unclassified Leucobacter]PIJ54834.1 hypothetical protein BMH30_01935 [Leucobacter sp. OLES1]PII81357.1 hypothetical protein BMH25_12405 [Leucobacter sp. OLCALW19]PII86025.1 hypothetical protein BMH26_12820 [Leucobacter sp. OLTLW20]PII89921.1 hypothetical protein BMH27_10985 [Leucobacter sp. OLAS13]PII96952.1 hypothetical protein BMH29_11670 [Leucobacter sp. OLDS2]
MVPDDLAAFEILAARVGLPVPALLRTWIADGRTQLPTALDMTLSEFLADSPLALVGRPDLEWLSPAEAATAVDDWLFADAQAGTRFLPFARSGAGDVYAVIRTPDERTACGMVWHDDETSEFASPDFASWAAVAFAETMTDLGPVTGRVADGRAVEALRTDLQQAASCFSPEIANTLTDWSLRRTRIRPFRAGPRARPSDAESLISQQEFEAFAGQLELREPIELAITPPWELP